MSSVQDRRAPSAGTKLTTAMKVDPGRNAPVAQEGAGFVASESLAAESDREGAAFSGNRGAQPEKTSSNAGMWSENTSSGNGATAPGYIVDQYLADPNGPHGKNLKEGGFDDSRIRDGLKEALNSEPGSMDDPSRLAEAKFARNEAAARDAGRKDEALSVGTTYDGLDRNTSS
ncbi:hypothetical protein TOPH_08119 [Tolypocladium ophioglossoides CBS 100239]|uniref:Uncharacterized protein n=1 Tax=Tolypocladium ophioglossoides (strain CBS 100239) TaxID=1163406 RepID=A0A0L0MZQ2_TOLOC|nr:hypothetical protein TOPH_08119 [Tolypocladium ophioglossoides CBS 100239]